MRIATGLLTACVAALVGAGLLGGCGSKDGGSQETAAAPSVSPTPADGGPKLAAAAARTSAGPYHFRVEDPSAAGRIEGGTDPGAKASTATLSVDAGDANPLTFQTISAGGALFVKITGLPATGGMDLSKYWLKADPARITGDIGLITTDPVDLAALAAAASSVRTVDGTLYTGTLDLTRVTTGVLHDEKMLQGLGDKARAVPFTASIDADGYLSALMVNVPAYGTEEASSVAVTLTNFGRPVTAAAPTGAQVIPMTDKMYSVLNAQ